MIRPSPIIIPANPISLPAPKEPAVLLLIRDNLCCEPLLIPRDLAINGGKIRIIQFHSIVDTEAEFADDGRPIAAAVVVAGCVEIGPGRQADVGVKFEVAVVIVGGEDVVGEVFFGVAGAPFGVLYFDLLTSVF